MEKHSQKHWSLNSSDDDEKHVDASMDDNNRVLVGEELFIEICEAWIERRGPTILRQVLNSAKFPQANAKILKKVQ